MTVTNASTDLDLAGTYLVIADHSVTAMEGGDAFWKHLASGEAPEVLDRGWLVGTYDYTATWDQWEMHPEGDEIVTVLTGHVDLVMDLGDSERTIPLSAGRTVVVPRGVWHTATVSQPASALHVTFGRGTRHRPRAAQGEPGAGG
jgi:mannose-6-phosphate isomerase-like protein (cupin superfamily)